MYVLVKRKSLFKDNLISIITEKNNFHLSLVTLLLHNVLQFLILLTHFFPVPSFQFPQTLELKNLSKWVVLFLDFNIWVVFLVLVLRIRIFKQVHLLQKKGAIFNIFIFNISSSFTLVEVGLLAFVFYGLS